MSAAQVVGQLVPPLHRNAPQPLPAWPAVTFAQVPFVMPVRALEQAWQPPLQVLLQQNPSTQAGVEHCEPRLQVLPCDCGATQAPPETPLHQNPVAQFASPAALFAPQLVLHVVELAHARLFAQGALGIVQTPDELQTGVVSVLPEQLFVPQDVPMGTVQAVAPVEPLQLPFWQVAGLAAGQLPLGSVPLVAATHAVPDAFMTEHACGQVNALQILPLWPCVQCPFTHWKSAVQAEPSTSCDAHEVPPTQ